MFRLDMGSGVPIYRQLMAQVRQELLLGRLRPGEQLPTVKEVVNSARFLGQMSCLVDHAAAVA